MTTAYYGINLGQKAEQTQIGTASPGTNLELKVDLGVIKTPLDLAALLVNVQEAIVHAAWPPA